MQCLMFESGLGLFAGSDVADAENKQVLLVSAAISTHLTDRQIDRKLMAAAAMADRLPRTQTIEQQPCVAADDVDGRVAKQSLGRRVER